MSPPAPWDRLRFLVVEDSPTMREWLRNAILNMGAHSVDQASNYRDALHRIRNRDPFDVILCDYVLAEERTAGGSGVAAVSRDGQHLLEECRRRRLIRTSCVFIMVTGERKYERVFAAAELAPDDYLLKPLTPQALADRLQVAYARRQAMKKMNDLFDAGHYDECVAACRSAEKAGFAYVLDSRKLAGECLMTLGRFEEAHRHYEAVLAQHPRLPWAKLGVARAFFHLDRYDESQSLLESILAGQSDFLQAHDLLARVHETRGNPAASREILREVLARNPRAIHRHREVIRMAMEVHDEEDAARAYDAMFSQGAGSSAMEASDFCGYTMLLMRDGGPAAQERLTKLIGTLNDHYVGPGSDEEKSAHFALAEVTAQFARARAKGDKAGAERFYRQLVSKAEEGRISDTNTRLALMEAAAAQGDTERALAIAREALADQAGNDAMSQRIVDVLGRHELREDAQRLCEITERAMLDLNRKAVELAKAGRMREAMEEFIRLAGETRNLSVTFNAALAIARWLDASQTCDEALVRKLGNYVEFIGNRDPDNPRLHQLKEVTQGWLRGRDGESAAAGDAPA